jgi:hypothetical protein
VFTPTLIERLRPETIQTGIQKRLALMKQAPLKRDGRLPAVEIQRLIFEIEKELSKLEDLPGYR